MKRLVVVLLILNPLVMYAMEPEEVPEELTLAQRYLKVREGELPPLPPAVQMTIAQELLSLGLEGFILSQVSLPFRDFVGHTDLIFSVGFNLTGDAIVTGSKDGTARIWNVATGGTIHTLQGQIAGFSPAGDQVVTGSRGGTIRIWNVANGAEILRFQGHVMAAFNPAGNQVVTGSPDITVTTATIRSVATGEILHTLPDHSPVILALFNAAGDRVVTGSQAGSTRIWEVASGKEIIHTDHGSPVTAALFNPAAGDKVVIGSEDGTVRIWDTATDKLLLLEGHSKAVISATFNQAGDKLVTGSWDSTAKIWDVKTGKLLHTLKGHTGFVSASFNPAGDKIITGSSGGTTKIWDAKTGNLLRTFQGQIAEFNPAGNKVVVAFRNTARIWDLEPLLKTQEFLKKMITLRQAVTLNAIYETIKARGIVRALEERAFTRVHMLFDPLPEEITFDFNDYPHLWKSYASLPEAIKEIFDPYVRKPV